LGRSDDGVSAFFLPVTIRSGHGILAFHRRSCIRPQRRGIVMPFASGHRQELSLSPSQILAAKKFQALWASHQTALRELQDVRLLVGVEGFKLLVAICAEHKAIRDAGFGDSRRGRATASDFLGICLSDLAHHFSTQKGR
jgi:hypothetical protein